MNRIFGWLSIAALLAVGLRAQGVSQVIQQIDRNSVDDPLARVREFTLQPHQPSALHEHPLNEVLIFREAGQITRTASTRGGENKVEKLQFQGNNVHYEAAGRAYVAENRTDHPIDVVEIELKNTPEKPPLSLSNLDMLVADPGHYQLVFENDQVRVLRSHFGPHEKGAMHQHARPRIVVNLSDDLRKASGDVHMRKPETHVEQNDSDYVVERLIVELK
jgi:hypothetical protein